MYEFYITIGKAIQQLSLSLNIGYLVFNILEHGFKNVTRKKHDIILIKSIVSLNVFVTFFLLFIQTSYYFNDLSAIFSISAFQDIIFETRYGFFWTIKIILIFILSFLIFLQKNFSTSLFLFLTCIISSLVVFTGHSASYEYKIFSIPLNIIHITFILPNVL